jgi:hypothetical protein
MGEGAPTDLTVDASGSTARRRNHFFAYFTPQP